MNIIKVEGMHCEKCVERISKALDEKGISHDISLENATVSIDGCENCLKTAKEIIYDLGFDVE